jgi:plasmid stability protein
MPTITLKNIPEDLHQRLRDRAARHHRSLNAEILACLEGAVRSEPVDPKAFVARIRDLRPPGHEKLTQDGRPPAGARALPGDGWKRPSCESQEPRRGILDS